MAVPQSLPAWLYADQRFFELERAKVFAQAWHIVGHTCDLRPQRIELGVEQAGRPGGCEPWQEREWSRRKISRTRDGKSASCCRLRQSCTLGGRCRETPSPSPPGSG